MIVLSDKEWQEFMSKHNMIWTKYPESWKDAPFLGNGLMGVSVYFNTELNSLHMELGRSDICDNRNGCFGNQMLYEIPRLQIGSFDLQLQGKIISFSMYLELLHAQLHGNIVTNKGKFEFDIMVHTKEMLVVNTYQGYEGEEKDYFKFTPAKAISPRHLYGLENSQDFRVCKNYSYYEDASILGTAVDGCSIQELSKDLCSVVAWRALKEDKKQILYIHINQGYEKEKVKSSSIEYVHHNWNLDDLCEIHYTWWENYYKRSFMSIPNKRLESFYWIQMYKLASATRANRAIIDNQGPWLCEPTPWPAIWWNLNVQLAYWPVYVSNHLDLNLSVDLSLIKYMDNLILNVPKEYQYDSAGIGTTSQGNLVSSVNRPGLEPRTGFRELGNLTWIMHNCWQYYQMTMNENYLRKLLYPLLRRCINYYIHFLEKREDNKWHLSFTSSPEYGIECEDCNYDLALILWGCKTLVYIVNKLDLEDEKYNNWMDIIKNLIDFPKDEKGFMIGKDLPYSVSHRHFSHLLMIYPLYLVTEMESNNESLIRKSLERWWSMPEKLCGFSCTGASLIAATIKDGDKALEYLNKLWEGHLLPNTLYMEEGPVIETPLSGARCLQDMLIQSYNGRIYLFPAIPSSWQDASFQDFCAQGGFVVSSLYQNGKISWVSILSKADEPCVIVNKDIEKLDLSDDRIIAVAENEITIMLAKGELIELKQKDYEGQIKVKLCVYSEQIGYMYGLNDTNMETNI